VRLIHLADFGGPYSGSFIPMLRKVIDRAKQRGWDAELLFTSTGQGRGWLRELTDDGYDTRIAPDLRRRQLAEWIGEVLAESDEPTLLHTHFTGFDVPAVVASRRRRAETYVVWHFHSGLSSSPLIRLRNRFKYRIFGKDVDTVLCVSQDQVGPLVARGLDAAKLEVFPNAIDTDRFRPADHEQRDRARSTLHLETDDEVLLHFGYDWHLKGGDRLVKALRSLRDRGDNSVIAVTVTDAIEASEALSDTAGLRVLGPMEDVSTLYAAADVYVSAGRAEGQPYAVLEALSSGLTVLASRLPGHAQIAEVVRTCRLVDMDDPEAFMESILAVLNRGQEERAEDAEAGREAVAASFGIDAWAGRLFSKYDEIAAAS
jgi:glycosyltransferase involved in cell wall biosynthesis